VTIIHTILDLRWFILVLGVLIFVHELGHFLAARRIGVRVLTFSLGFGPKLFAFRRGDTEYCVSAIPLGGYVKMAGENPEDARTGASDEFLSKSKWQRFQVLIMGSVMNLALELVVMAFVLYHGADVAAFNDEAPVVGSIEAESPAIKADIRPGDHIVAVNDAPVETWNEFSIETVTKAERAIKLTIIRDGKTIDRQVVPLGIGKYQEGYIGVMPRIRPQISSVQRGHPAEAAGLRRGDVIIGVNGEKPVSQERVVDIIRANEGRELRMDILRDGSPQVIAVTPRKSGDLVMIGAQISPYELRTIRPTLPGAFKLSAERNYEFARLIVRTLVGLFTRDTPVKQLMGPVAIAGLSGEAAQAGWIQLFSLMAMISLNLGLLNLMPIPVLDGGHITILALEGLSRRDFSMKVKEKMLLGGFVLLLMLMVTVIYNDLARIQWIQKLLPWR